MVTHSVHSTLNSIGGIQVLFPLFAQLDLPSSESQTSSNEITTTASTNDKSSTATAVSTKDQSLWYVYTIYIYYTMGQQAKRKILWYQMNEFHGIFFGLAIHKWHHPLKGEEGSVNRWWYSSTSLSSKMGDKGEGGVINPKKWVTSYINGPKV